MCAPVALLSLQCMCMYMCIFALLFYNPCALIVCRDIVLGDLETAEARLDDAYAENDKEKNLRYKSKYNVYTSRGCRK